MDLVAKKREVFGRKTATLRLNGVIPAELYGHGIENIHLSVQKKEFTRVLKSAGESSLVNILLGSKAGEKRPVFINNVQRDYLSDEIVSIDFYQVNLKEKIKVSVPLNFVGNSQAIKDGGVLVRSMQEVEVEALPQEIPHEIQVDISKLSKFGDSVYVRDLVMPKNIKLTVGLDNVIGTVIEKAAEEEMPAPQVAVEDIKVETEEKKVERQAKKEAKEAPEAKKPEAKKPEAKK